MEHDTLVWPALPMRILINISKGRTVVAVSACGQSRPMHCSRPSTTTGSVMPVTGDRPILPYHHAPRWSTHEHTIGSLSLTHEDTAHPHIHPNSRAPHAHHRPWHTLLAADYHHHPESQVSLVLLFVFLRPTCIYPPDPRMPHKPFDHSTRIQTNASSIAPRLCLRPKRTDDPAFPYPGVGSLQYENNAHSEVTI